MPPKIDPIIPKMPPKIAPMSPNNPPINPKTRPKSPPASPIQIGKVKTIRTIRSNDEVFTAGQVFGPYHQKLFTFEISGI